jgi:hypothetical protein
MMYAFMDINSTIAARADLNPPKAILGLSQEANAFRWTRLTDRASVFELAGTLPKTSLDPFACTSVRRIIPFALILK